jgi:hypothetical protein
MLGPKGTAVDAIYALNLFEKETGGQPAGDGGEAAAPTEETAAYLRMLREYGISGEKVATVIDGEQKMVTMEELAKTFPDIFETQARLMLKMTEAQEKRFQKMLAESGYAKADDLKDLRAMADERKVLAKHSDANAIEADPKFAAWRKTLSAPFQALYDSGKPDNKIAIIDLWKETQAKEANASIRNRQGDIHRRKASVHSETLRGTPPPSGASGAGHRDDDDDFAAEANTVVK